MIKAWFERRGKVQNLEYGVLIKIIINQEAKLILKNYYI